MASTTVVPSMLRDGTWIEGIRSTRCLICRFAILFCAAHRGRKPVRGDLDFVPLTPKSCIWILGGAVIQRGEQMGEAPLPHHAALHLPDGCIFLAPREADRGGARRP